MEPAFLGARRGAWGRLTALIFPASCVACGATVDHAALGALCESCWRSGKWLKGGENLRSGAAWHFDACHASCAFEGAFREALHAYKFSAKTVFRRPFLDLLAASARLSAADLLAWVPTAKASLKERGYDSTAELAIDLSKRLDMPLYQGLQRVRQGEKQAGLGREERWLNAKNAFHATDALTGKRMLLVDDVVTTGATLSECAAALKRAGAANVNAIALASGELRGN